MPKFQLHWAKQTGPYEFTTWWTMVMKFIPLPWKPELIFCRNLCHGHQPRDREVLQPCGLLGFYKEE
ncbi:hypothetical protein ACFX11_026526 [Malus domestica]